MRKKKFVSMKTPGPGPFPWGNPVLAAVCALFISLPFIHWGLQFESFKTRVFLGMGVLLSLFLIRGFRTGVVRTEASDLPYWLFVGWSALVSIAGNGWQTALSGGDYRHQGVLFFFVLGMGALVVRSMPVRWKRTGVTLIIFSTLIESVIVITQYIFSPLWRTLAYKGPLGTLGEPNAAAAVIVFGLLFTLGSPHPGRWKTVLWVTGCTALALLQATTAGVIALAALIAYGVLTRRTRIVPPAALVGAGLAAVTVIMVWVYAGPDLSHEPVSRYVIWRRSIAAIAERPLTGYGLDSSEEVLSRQYALAGINIGGLTVERSHTLWLDILVWSGIPGLVLFVLWISMAFGGRGWSGAPAAGTLRLLSWITYASFHPVGIVHWLYLIYMLHL